MGEKRQLLGFTHYILNSLPPLSKNQTPQNPKNLFFPLRESHLQSDNAAVSLLR